MIGRWVWAGVAAALLAACSSEAPGPDIKLYALDCGRLSVSDADVFADDGAYAGQARDLVDPCYLIRHPDGDLLWDAGLPEALGPEGATYFDIFHVTVPVKLTDQLAQLGLTPADVEFVSFSHSHFDHTGNANLFAHAIWIADPEEREWMFRDEAREADTFALYDQLENAQTRLIEGDDDYDVFGDGSVTIIQAPGHTPGHTVLMVKLREAGPVLLTGDMWHMAESREARRVPRFNEDREQTLASMDKVEAIAKQTGARVVRQHVPEDFAAMPAFPAPLE